MFGGVVEQISTLTHLQQRYLQSHFKINGYIAYDKLEYFCYVPPEPLKLTISSS